MQAKVKNPYWAALLALCLTPACSNTTVNVADVRGPVREERRLRDPDAPLVHGDWHVTPHSIEGHLTWQYCDIERTWTTKRVKTTEHEAHRSAGAAMLGLGAVLTFLGAVTMNHDDPNADNTGPWMLTVSGAALGIPGIIAFAGKNGTTTETLSSKQEHEVVAGSCLPTRDFKELLFALKVGPQLWRVRVSPQGDARVTIPEGEQVPPNLDLQLIVFRAPKAAADVVTKGQVLETFRLAGE